MMDAIGPPLYVLGLWWGGTALVFLLERRPGAGFRRTMAWASLAGVVALCAVWLLRDVATPAGAYGGLLAGFVLWAWLEIGFYTGFVTGPRPVEAPARGSEWRRLACAVHASLFHEIGILALAGAVLWLTRGAANDIALWTLVFMTIAHQSARLNVFFGVRNVEADLLPEHLAHFRSYFRQRPGNAFYPVALGVTVGATLAFAIVAVGAPAASYGRSASALLSAICGIAALEHVLLMIPMSTERLWSASLAREATSSRARVAPSDLDRAATPQ